MLVVPNLDILKIQFEEPQHEKKLSQNNLR